MKYGLLKKKIEAMNDKPTDEPRWSFTDAFEELEKEMEESIRQGIMRIHHLTKIADNL